MRLFEETRRRLDAHGCRIVNKRTIRLVDGRGIECWPVLREDVTLSGGPALDDRPRATSWEPGHGSRLPPRFAQ